MNTDYNRDLIEDDFNLYHKHFRQFGDNGTLDHAKQILQCSYLIPSADLVQKWHISVKLGEDVLSFRSSSPATLRRLINALGVVWSEMNSTVKEMNMEEFNAIAEQFIAEFRKAIYLMKVEE